MSENHTTAPFHDLLDNGEAQTDAFMVHGSCSLQFAKASEQFREVVRVDALARVLNLNH